MQCYLGDPLSIVELLRRILTGVHEAFQITLRVGRWSCAGHGVLSQPIFFWHVQIGNRSFERFRSRADWRIQRVSATPSNLTR